MSYELSNSKPIVVLYGDLFNNVVHFGEYEIPMDDFCYAIKYVMTNTDLYENDPRLKLIEDIKKTDITDGWNKIREPNCKRIAFRNTKNV